MSTSPALSSSPRIAPRAVIELLKPVTWFAPSWAFACGAFAGGVPGTRFAWAPTVAGMILAGPLVCGASQAMNDWCDRHVDAINQPDRPIPSGRLPGQTGLLVAVVMSALAIAFAAMLGPLVLAAGMLALFVGWAYSAPPLRLKTSGWIGPLATAFSYEGIAWITGSLVAGQGALPSPANLAIALLYSIGAYGIMTLNDFKAVAGDRAMGIDSLPVILGVARAAKVACIAMAVPQAVVAAMLARDGMPLRAGVIAVLVGGQVGLMRRLLRDPERYAPWYNGTGVTLFVTGMMVAAFAVRGGMGG